MKKILVFALSLGLLGQSTLAADIASDVRNGDDSPDTSDGGFLEVGLFGHVGNTARVDDDGQGRSGAGLVVAFKYRFQGLFAEAINGSSDGLNLGYNLWNNQHWAVDLIAVNATSGGSEDIDSSIANVEDVENGLSERMRDYWLMDRRASLTGSGLRLTGYFGDYIFQYRLLNDVYNNRGNYSTARLGRSWQYRNWNFHGILSLSYLDAKFAQHAIGVSALEATTRFPQYHPGAALSYQAEIGVTYPLNEHWVFRSTLKQHFLSSEAKASPLYDSKSQTSLTASFSYVF